jgi:hypothetical protein
MAVRLSALHVGRTLPPRRIPDIQFCQRLSRTQGHNAAGKIRSIEKMTSSGREPPSASTATACSQELKSFLEVWGRYICTGNFLRENQISGLPVEHVSIYIYLIFTVGFPGIPVSRQNSSGINISLIWFSGGIPFVRKSRSICEFCLARGGSGSWLVRCVRGKSTSNSGGFPLLQYNIKIHKRHQSGLIKSSNSAKKKKTFHVFGNSENCAINLRIQRQNLYISQICTYALKA